MSYAIAFASVRTASILALRVGAIAFLGAAWLALVVANALVSVIRTLLAIRRFVLAVIDLYADVPINPQVTLTPDACDWATYDTPELDPVPDTIVEAPIVTLCKYDAALKRLKAIDMMKRYFAPRKVRVQRPAPTCPIHHGYVITDTRLLAALTTPKTGKLKRKYQAA